MVQVHNSLKNNQSIRWCAVSQHLPQVRRQYCPPIIHASSHLPSAACSAHVSRASGALSGHCASYLGDGAAAGLALATGLGAAAGDGVDGVVVAGDAVLVGEGSDGVDVSDVVVVGGIGTEAPPQRPHVDAQ